MGTITSSPCPSPGPGISTGSGSCEAGSLPGWLTVAWGANQSGDIPLPDRLTNVQAPAAGADHSVALRSDGTVAAWELNTSGQINFPADLAGGEAVSAGVRHSLALKSDGVMVVAGYNGFGDNLPAGESRGIRQISAGNFSMALKNDRTPRVPGTGGSTSVECSGWIGRSRGGGGRQFPCSGATPRWHGDGMGIQFFR